MKNEFCVDKGTNEAGQSIRFCQIDDDGDDARSEYRVYVDGVVECHTESGYKARLAFDAALALVVEADGASTP